MSGKPVKSWQARLSKAADALTEQFVESISLDWRLAKYDIAGSVVHAEMLAEVGLITHDELRQIKQGLKAIDADIDAGKLKPNVSQEDVHMVVEADLIKRAGSAGQKLHTARSRNDQVSLDMRLWMRDAIDREIVPRIVALQAALVGLADEQGQLLMPGYTHLQRAQPVLLGAYLLAYAEMLDRDRQRFEDARRRVNVCPLGAGALAGTTLPIDRQFVADRLGFAAVAANSMDATSDRDFCLEYAGACSQVMVHLSRLAEDWILYNSCEFGFLRIDDAFCTGSSMMPQKRNPDLLELVRGKTGRVFGAVAGLLAMLKAQPLSYNRDVQEDKFHVFTAHDTTSACLKVFEAIVRNSRFDGERMSAVVGDGLPDATALAEYLVGKGVPFRQAHQIVGALAAECDQQGQRLGDLPLEQLQRACDRIEDSVYEYLGPANVVRRYRSEGAAGTESLERQLKQWRERLR
ncbi:MAG TPA: argininosuccinate lyase [Phycisphaerae bacterium]|nr:argininosuccinate lyase [Phycisphaerae bacterium]